METDSYSVKYVFFCLAGSVERNLKFDSYARAKQMALLKIQSIGVHAVEIWKNDELIETLYENQ